MQTRFAKNFYIIIERYFSPENLKVIVNKALLIIFVYVYALRCLVLLYKDKVKFNKKAKEVEYFLIHPLPLSATYIKSSSAQIEHGELKKIADDAVPSPCNKSSNLILFLFHDDIPC
jgi:glucan phosphoethanolaminetransferase (alkaline phosphatase superfamily)